PDDPAGGIELGHAIALRIPDPVAEDGGAMLALVRLPQQRRQSGAVEDVVAQHEAARRAVEEFARDEISLRQPPWLRLRRVLDAHAPLRTIAQQRLEQCLL